MAIRTDMKLVENPLAPKSSAPTRDGFGKGLVELGEGNPNVWAVSADVSESTRTHWFAEKFPTRFVQVGVAEQNLAGVGAGIASCGKIVFISAFGVFSPGRNWDQIRVSICYNDVPVIIHASHTGLTVGPDGASHQALEDIAIVRVLPNMTVIVPSDMEQAKKRFMQLPRLGSLHIFARPARSYLFSLLPKPRLRLEKQMFTEMAQMSRYSRAVLLFTKR